MMYGGGMSPSLADIAAVTRGNGMNGYNDGFGGGNGWWVLIILFAIFGGWGNGGYGGGNNGTLNSGLTDAALQRGFDTQTIISKLDGLNAGVCSLGYDQLNQMNGINSTVMQTGYGLQQSINQLGVSNMQDTFALQQAINNGTVAGMQNTQSLSRQLSECCCDQRAALKDLQYNLATQSCATNNNIHQTGDAIIQNQNQNFQMLNNTIRDGFCSLEMREMQRENQALRDRLNACDRDSALLAQSNYLIDRLQPCSRPSYLTCNPNTGLVFPMQMYANNGCGNGLNLFGNNGCGGCCNG